MTKYLCEQPAEIPNWRGHYACDKWIEYEPQANSLLDSLAITPAQAGEIAIAICSVLVIGYIFGLIGSFLKSMVQ